MERATFPRFFYHRPALSGQPAAPEIGGRPRCDVFIVRLVGIRKDMAPFDTMVHCVRQATCLAFHQSGAHPVRVGAVVVVPVAIGVHVQGVVGVVGVRGAEPPVGGRQRAVPCCNTDIQSETLPPHLTIPNYSVIVDIPKAQKWLEVSA